MRPESFSIFNKVEKYHWWFRVRRELLTLLLKKYYPHLYNPKLKILNIGCGTGEESLALRLLGEVYSLDSSSEALEFCRKKGLKNLYQGVAQRLPFGDSFFDLVVSLDVLEHLKDDVSAVNETKRVLKEGGIFICFVPAFLFLWSKQDNVLMHYRRYTQKSLALLFINKWQCLKLTYFNFFLFLPIFLMRIISNFFNLGQKDEVEQLSFLNLVFYKIFKSELLFLRYLNFPFGVSLLGVFQKKNI